jgi:hypothetical protein
MRRRLALASTEDLLNASTRFQAAREHRETDRSSSIGSGSEFWVKTRPGANWLGSLTKEANQDGENRGD